MPESAASLLVADQQKKQSDSYQQCNQNTDIGNPETPRFVPS
jgi:hypothetical protein